MVHRYIHIENYGSETNATITITGCSFNNMDKCDDDGITIVGVSLDNIYVGNNKTDNETNFTNDIWIQTSSSTYWYQYSNIDDSGYNDIFYFPRKTSDSTCYGYVLTSPSAHSSANMFII